MKRHTIIAGCAGLLLGGAAGGSVIYGKSGHTFGADITIGESARFSQAELEQALETVTDTFRSDFQSCQLQSLIYDEERSDRYKSESYDTPETIILFSDFIGVPTPILDDTIEGQQKDWHWILRQDDDGEWELLTWGYG